MHNNRNAHPRSILAAALLSATAAGSAIAADPSGLVPLAEPPKFDAAKAKPGSILFFDTRLAGDTGNSCASCHDPGKGWGDGKALSDSYTSLLYFRNAPSLFNVAGRKYLMWDGRLDGADLGTSVRDMITEAHTMNMDTRLAQERLKQSPEYMAMFEAAFGKGDPYGGKIYGAIAEYMKTIVTTNAPLDKHLKGDAAALNEQQKAGMKLFTGKAGCAACHSGPMLSDGKLHVTGVPDNPDVNANADRQVTMLRHFATMGTPNYMNLRADVGHYVVSKDSKDIGRFATPSLWDVGQTAPYMHSGMFRTLAEVVDFYDKGGGTAPNKAPQLKPLNLTADEKSALVAFLGAMTGDKPNVPKPQIPKDAPRTHGTN